MRRPLQTQRLLDAFRASGLDVKSFPDDADREVMPFVVECNDLNRTAMSDPFQFEEELRNRVAWCNNNAPGAHLIEPIRDPATHQLIGRAFRFTSQDQAALFKLFFV